MEKKSIYAVEIYAEAPEHRATFYEALRKVFAIPPLGILRDAEKVAAWREERWGDDQYFAGPEVYYEADGKSILIITETSGRHIRVVFGDDGSIIFSKIVFPHGSLYAATRILEELRDLLPEEEWEKDHWEAYHRGGFLVVTSDGSGRYPAYSASEAYEVLSEALAAEEEAEAE